jgi:hypothetical protein
MEHTCGKIELRSDGNISKIAEAADFLLILDI